MSMPDPPPGSPSSAKKPPEKRQSRIEAISPTLTPGAAHISITLFDTSGENVEFFAIASPGEYVYRSEQFTIDNFIFFSPSAFMHSRQREPMCTLFMSEHTFQLLKDMTHYEAFGDDYFPNEKMGEKEGIRLGPDYNTTAEYIPGIMFATVWAVVWKFPADLFDIPIWDLYVNREYSLPVGFYSLTPDEFIEMKITNHPNVPLKTDVRKMRILVDEVNLHTLTASGGTLPMIGWEYFIKNGVDPMWNPPTPSQIEKMKTMFAQLNEKYKIEAFPCHQNHHAGIVFYTIDKELMRCTTLSEFLKSDPRFANILAGAVLEEKQGQFIQWKKAWVKHFTPGSSPAFNKPYSPILTPPGPSYEAVTPRRLTSASRLSRSPRGSNQVSFAHGSPGGQKHGTDLRYLSPDSAPETKKKDDTEHEPWRELLALVDEHMTNRAIVLGVLHIAKKSSKSDSIQALIFEKMNWNVTFQLRDKEEKPVTLRPVGLDNYEYYEDGKMKYTLKDNTVYNETTRKGTYTLEPKWFNDDPFLSLTITKENNKEKEYLSRWVKDKAFPLSIEKHCLFERRGETVIVKFADYEASKQGVVEGDTVVGTFRLSGTAWLSFKGEPKKETTFTSELRALAAETVLPVLIRDNTNVFDEKAAQAFFKDSQIYGGGRPSNKLIRYLTEPDEDIDSDEFERIFSQQKPDSKREGLRIARKVHQEWKKLNPTGLLK